MGGYWILDKDKNLIEIYDWRDWATWHAQNRQLVIVGFNHLPNGITVSTRFLENTIPKSGKFFETFVFGGNFQNENDEFPVYYKTYQEAIEGHLELINTLLT